MAKREADTYLTDQNWDKELPEEKVKDFVLVRKYLLAHILWTFTAFSKLSDTVVFLSEYTWQTGSSSFWSGFSQVLKSTEFGVFINQDPKSPEIRHRC